MSQIDQPPWLAFAWAELGQRETAGANSNPRIRAFFADAGHPEIGSDETAWCAAFAGACLHRAGLPPTGSLLARSYSSWGRETVSRTGAIAVLSRDGAPSLGHVGFLVGETSDTVILLGGNQHDAVTVAAFQKSRLLSLRWPAGSEAGAHPAPGGADDLFSRALAHVLEMEGGYTCDPADPGGPTNFGITLADYARFRRAPLDSSTRAALLDGLRHIPRDDVHAIYLDRYWTKPGCPHLPAAVAFFHFDTAVNMGTGTAIGMLQTALGCTIDGEMGQQTIAAAAAADTRGILEAYADLRRRRYRSLATFPRFGRGWLARVDTTLTRSLSLISNQQGRHMTDQVAVSASSTDSGPASPAAPEPKWWGRSLTIWGAVVTGLAAVLPAVGPALGVEITPDVVQTSAGQIAAIAQAAAGLAGTFAAIIGRLRASQPLRQRTLTLKL